MLRETTNQTASWSIKHCHGSMAREFSDTQKHTCTVSPLTDSRHRWQMLDTASCAY